MPRFDHDRPDDANAEAKRKVAAAALAEYQRRPRRSLRDLGSEIALWTWTADLSDFAELEHDLDQGARLGSEERIILGTLLTLVQRQIEHRDNEVETLRAELDGDVE